MIEIFAILLITYAAPPNPEELMTTVQMAEYWGYPIESHLVVSQDGYILKIFRIPGHQGESLENAKATRKPPVILQHGLICSSDQFLDAGALSQAYILADEGYDIWIPNIRGNRYSRDHMVYEADDVRYWNYTFEEMAIYDQKAYWEYIMKVTGYNKLGFVAHSQGTTQMFVAMSYDPEYYAEHLSAFVAQSPVTSITHTTSKVLSSAAYIDLPKKADELGIHNLLPFTTPMAKSMAAICKLIPLLCNFGVEMVADDEPLFDNQDRMPVFLSHYPSGSSSKNYEHIMQLVSYGFVRYRYKNTDPLQFYNITKIPKSVNIALLAGKADKLACPHDSKNLKNILERVGNLKFYREYDHMGHLTFLIPTEETMDFATDTLLFLQKYYMAGIKRESTS